MVLEGGMAFESPTYDKNGANKYSRPSFIVMTAVSIDVGKEGSYK